MAIGKINLNELNVVYTYNIQHTTRRSQPGRGVRGAGGHWHHRIGAPPGAGRVSALLAKQDEEWMTAKIYLYMKS
jgi:hypothetical protein